MNKTQYKVCSRASCRKKLPATTEFFYKNAVNKCGLQAMCRECQKEVKRNKYGGKQKPHADVESSKLHVRQYINPAWNPNSQIYKKKPKNRTECEGRSRPCPWVSCKWHMFSALSEREQVNFTDENFHKLIFTMVHTCILDVCDKGGKTLDYLGKCLGITRERIRQIEDYKNGGAIKKLQHKKIKRTLKIYISDKGVADGRVSIGW